MDPQTYLVRFNGSGQDASSAPGPMSSGEIDILPVPELFGLEVVQEYAVTVSSTDLRKMMLTALEPQTSTPVRQAYISSDPVASGSQEPDMDDMEKEWVNSRLEAAQERSNAQLAGMQSRLDIGIVRLESQVTIISENVRQLADVVKGIHADGQETRSEIDRLVRRMDETNDETRKQFNDTKEETRRQFHDLKTYQTGMRLWYVGTTIVLFLGLVAVATFGKDMFEWGRGLSP